MEPRHVKSTADARAIVEERNLSHVKVGLFDIDGVLRGKYMAREKFFSALDSGFGFCDVVLGWDSYDQLYDNVRYTGWHTGYPDAPVHIAPDTCRSIPFERDMLLFLCEFAPPANAICPRGLLHRVLERGRQMGLEARAGFEYEFFVFNETPLSAREKRYRNLTPLAPGYFGYSVLRSSVHADLYHLLLQTCEAMDFPLEGLHEETGPGVLEAALAADNGVQAADKAALFKTFTKIVAQRENLMATFMAKWSPEWPGSSGHVHLSLHDATGRAVFYDEQARLHMSAKMRHFIAGQQTQLPSLLAMVSPTVNSFTRLIPGFWAPTDASYGIENRTCALRAIPGSRKSQRVEFRVGAADANPYIILAAALAAGLWGIETEAELGEPVSGNAYEQHAPDTLKFPATLFEAAERLQSSPMARDWFGDEFVEHYAASREWEEREYRRHISDWEMERYFEII